MFDPNGSCISGQCGTKSKATRCKGASTAIDVDGWARAIAVSAASLFPCVHTVPCLSWPTLTCRQPNTKKSVSRASEKTQQNLPPPKIQCLPGRRKKRRAPVCRDARVYGQTTTATSDMSTPPPPATPNNNSTTPQNIIPILSSYCFPLGTRLQVLAHST